MNKKQFIQELDTLLQGINEVEKEKTLLYYEEIISDKIEDGISEEDAVASCGKASDIASELLSELPLTTLIQSKVKQSHEKSKNKTLWMVLAICGFPIWFPLAISFAAIIISVYISVWAIVISLFAVELALAISTIAGLIFGIWNISTGKIATGFGLISMSVMTIGLFVLSIKPLYWLSKQIIGLTSLFLKKIKLLFIQKKGV